MTALRHLRMPKHWRWREWRRMERQDGSVSATAAQPGSARSPRPASPCMTARCSAATPANGRLLALSGVELLAPCAPGKIVGSGIIPRARAKLNQPRTAGAAYLLKAPQHHTPGAVTGLLLLRRQDHL